ncbi:putative calcium/calmodulin-dependent protein kinase chromatin remodeling SNF2 family [Rosa chinensis]|uniref:Putative calcium/calmodulin-dependent protein kinase chromatin remodeling SNF2 family n=1 Tax=Rosa chinensis TaxID=74649 RepID=A0A2P6QQF6_ROSCH|nr:DNA repair protein RAD5B [Rosa chinensis]PRQ36424.1 putative calcium/calmodulin-dependent protein kinase chromatin remodeling SNF2 family [Rosa chinensis]
MSMINQEDSDEPETFAGSKRKSLPNSEGSIKRAKPISTHHIKQKQVCEEEPIEAETGLGSNDPRIRVKQEAPDAQQGLTHQQENVMNRITGARISRSEEESNNGSKPKRVKKEVADCELISVQHVRPQNLEDGDFKIEPDWFLVGSTLVTAVSTSKGMKLLDNEIVHLSFPTSNSSYKTQWIVRFSTKRSGEIGRFPMEWAKCVVPLVNSGKVKVLGRFMGAPKFLSMIQDIILSVSFFIHHSIFTDGDNYTVPPLLGVLNLLKIEPYQKAEFTAEELDSQKCILDLQHIPDQATSVLRLVKRGRGCQQYREENKDEEAISESSINKTGDAADVYDFEEMASALMSDLSPYQKQALYRMLELEKGIDVEISAHTLHPCWVGYRICDERASSIYVNIFSGEATTQFPTIIQMARGGIIADAMGLGKTVMTIALIIARPSREGSKNIEITKRQIDSHRSTPWKPKGGTLVVCPESFLSQWKDELETHSESQGISFLVFVRGRDNNNKMISEKDVVLTEYDILADAYAKDKENSIFHQVDWYRVVLDEAHNIESSCPQYAEAASTLSSHCRWCLTGTPLQINLDDIYSLLCLLNVEPWCDWMWWNKLIQMPYESGDPRGQRLLKAILSPLMLRRTKETKDKDGRPILVLPPDIHNIQCDQLEAEHEFYEALFHRSKVQFEQIVAQGKVLHNYSSVLELLLKLRQCCSHPCLVMRGDSHKFADSDKLARRSLESNHDSLIANQIISTQACIEEVVKGICGGKSIKCPICLDFADDPVRTPCAHQMCRECLLSSWPRPSFGQCQVCFNWIGKTDLITCKSENHCQSDIKEILKESSKVSKLLECLKHIVDSGSNEKSIVFSQWASFLDLLETSMKRRGIGCVRFDGKLPDMHRDRALAEFSKTTDKMVLLMSLKTGGDSLDLTAASNVFLMDPPWNPDVEEEAIMRILRNRRKRTAFIRFIVKDTVEERLQQVQARKQRMIAGALTDNEVQSARIEELKILFA